jgi:hypothetical protein
MLHELASEVAALRSELEALHDDVHLALAMLDHLPGALAPAPEDEQGPHGQAAC